MPQQHGAHKSIFHLQPKKRLKEVAGILAQLFGEAHTRVSVHIRDPNDQDKPIALRVEVGKAGAADAVNEGIAKKLLLRNALNASSLEATRPAGGKAKVALLITGSTTLRRIQRAELVFAQRERAKRATDALIMLVVFSVSWRVLLWAWRLAFT